MRALIEKLKLKKFDDIYILNKPDNFETVFTDINHSESLVTTSCVECAVVFSKTKEEFINQMLTLFPRLMEGSVIWVFFPNETTKGEISKLHLEYDWDFLGDYRLKPTKQINVDEHWDAMKVKPIRS
ncbi:hypothetical protein GSB9_01151 [Flavobacteriaceae bacterium GSB9]|nr:hypothetical protein GSB9_01151 [Flavobacteriaceae bacterium GSB9]